MDRSMENAWSEHDKNPEGWGCEKEKDYNEHLGHSHFNDACKRKVFIYARDHRMEVKKMTIDLPIRPKKIPCVHCKRRFHKEELNKVIDLIEGPLNRTYEYYLCEKCSEKKLSQKGYHKVIPPAQAPESADAHPSQECHSQTESAPVSEDSKSPQKTADKSSQDPSASS